VKESRVWSTLCRNWGAVRMMRIENSCCLGTPDVCLCAPGGRVVFMELKLITEGFPKRATTPVRITHFTQEQRLWLAQWGASGVACWVFVQVVDVGYFLFDHVVAQDIGLMTQSDWESQSTYRMPARGGDWKTLYLHVCGAFT
jgi:hypothetical protein